MSGLVLLSDGTAEQAFFVGVALAVAGAIAFPLLLKDHLATRTDESEEALRREWRRLAPVVVANVAVVIGIFVFDGWPRAICGAVALITNIFIARRLQNVMKPSA